MRKILICGILLATFTGCDFLSPRDNLSPEFKQKLENDHSTLNGVSQDQAALKAEIAKLNNELTLLKQEYQEGLLNYQSNHENYGIQILGGNGGIVLVFSVLVIGMLLIYLYEEKNKMQKLARLLASQIEIHDNPDLNDKIVESAKISGLDKELMKLL